MADPLGVTLPSRASIRVVLLFAPLVLVPALWGLDPSPTWLGRVRSCDRMVEVEGELRCDEELEVLSDCPDLAWTLLNSGDSVLACARGRMAADSLERLDLPVDINRASLAELASLPGIGPVLAERIAAGRPYISVDDLDRVSGIGPKRMADLRARARVE